MERKKTNTQYIITLLFHLLFFPGMFMAYSFATEKPFASIFESMEPLVSTLITLVSVILFSEAIVRLNFKTSPIANHYSGTQYLIRRFIRSFFLNGAIFAIMFATELAPFAVPAMFVYYLLVTPSPIKFKQFTQE